MESVATVQRLAAAGMPLNLPAALARVAAQQQQHQLLASAALGTAQGIRAAAPPVNPPLEQDLQAVRRLASLPLQDAGLSGRGVLSAAPTGSHTLRFAAQHAGVLGQMAPPPRPSSAPLPPSMAGLRPMDGGNRSARTHLNGQIDAHQLLAAQAATQLGAGAGTPFQARPQLAHALRCC